MPNKAGLIQYDIRFRFQRGIGRIWNRIRVNHYRGARRHWYSNLYDCQPAFEALKT